jgi:hypothetical protein
MFSEHPDVAVIPLSVNNHLRPMSKQVAGEDREGINPALGQKLNWASCECLRSAYGELGQRAQALIERETHEGVVQFTFS